MNQPALNLWEVTYGEQLDGLSPEELDRLVDAAFERRTSAEREWLKRELRRVGTRSLLYRDSLLRAMARRASNPAAEAQRARELFG